MKRWWVTGSSDPPDTAIDLTQYVLGRLGQFIVDKEPQALVTNHHQASRTPILVTGALGNVGSAVVTSLLERGERNIRVADIDTESLAVRYADLEAARLDYTDTSTFEPAVRGSKRLFLIRPPAISRVGNTINPFLDTASEHGVEHIVFSSVAGAESNRMVPHHRIEAHLMQSSIAWTMLRPGFFAQNIATAYRSDIVNENRIYVPAGDGLVAFIDARDIGEVAALCLTETGHEGHGYHLTGPEAVSFYDLAALLADRLQRTIRYRPAPVLRYYQHLRQQQLARPHAIIQTILHTGLRRGDAEEVTTTVQDLLGKPPTTLRQYVNDNREVWE